MHACMVMRLGQHARDSVQLGRIFVGTRWDFGARGRENLKVENDSKIRRGEGGGGTNRSDKGLNLSGSWQQGHSAAYNTPSRI